MKATSSHRFGVLGVALPAAGVAVIFLIAARALSFQPLSALIGATPRQLLTIDPTPTFMCKASEGDVVVTGFTIRNVSSGPVTVLGASSSCGCTVALGKFPIELASGDTGKIDAQVHVGTPNSEGEFTKSLILLVNRAGAVPPLIVEVTVIGTDNSR